MRRTLIPYSINHSMLWHFSCSNSYIAEIKDMTVLAWTLQRRNSATDCNGKEKDYESGFHYYGARYYWGELLTGWLSVDLMSDKYPSMSPYNYCAWNPVKLIDPDGKEPDIYMIPQKGGDTFLKASKHIKTRENTFQILIHGNNLGMREVQNGQNVSGDKGRINSAKKFDEVFRNNAKWEQGKNKKGFEVILFSCNTGRGDNSIAMQLSNEYQNITVIAPSRQVWVNKNGIVGTYGKTDSGKKNKSDPGYWLVFQKGEVVAAYDSSWMPGKSTKGHNIDISTIAPGHIDGVPVGNKEFKKGDKDL